MTMMMTVALN